MNNATAIGTINLESLGTHLLLDLRECDSTRLDDLEFIQTTLVESARLANATIVGHTFHKFSPQGVTGVVAIAESHICIHTWPEYNYAAVDIFTCGETVDPQFIATYITERLGSNNPDIRQLSRGFSTQSTAPSHT
jgi:S-adenosylmethionine decarboxylase